MSNGHSDIPKAILYSWNTSVWAAIPLITLIEKGYDAETEYIVKEVDITKGENFSPAYLKINANGTVPTLVVPTAETTGAEVASRYRSLRDTVTIVEFLDHARSAQTTQTTSGQPAPALSPATIEGKTLSDSLTALVHLPTVDPNFFFLSARDPAELKRKSDTDSGEFVRNRQFALAGYVAEAEQNLSAKLDSLNNTSGVGPSKKDFAAGGAGGQSHAGAGFESKTLAFLKDKAESNQLLYEIYSGEAPADRLQGFFAAGVKAWRDSLPDVLTKLDAAMTGPFALGDQISLADIHIISWLARTIQIATGKLDSDGVDGLAKAIGTEYVAGPKLKAFWKAWSGRESFSKVFVSNWLNGEPMQN